MFWGAPWRNRGRESRGGKEGSAGGSVGKDGYVGSRDRYVD